MRHGDKKTKFETGAQRDTAEGKGRPSLISPVLMHRVGILLEKGAKHYGSDNWTKGMSCRRTMDSLLRHAFQWLAGDEEEDHLAAVVFGAMCLMHFDDVPNLDDRCKGLKKILPSLLTKPEPDATVKSEARKDDRIVGQCDGCGVDLDPLYKHECKTHYRTPPMPYIPDRVDAEAPPDYSGHVHLSEEEWNAAR